jgi:hypothetical protein
LVANGKYRINCNPSFRLGDSRCSTTLLEIDPGYRQECD